MKYSSNRKYRDLISEKEEEMQAKKPPLKTFFKRIKNILFLLKKNITIKYE